MLLENIIRQNVPRQFPLHKPEDDAVGSLSRTVYRFSNRVTVGRIAELQTQYGNALALAQQKEPTSVADLRKLREEERETDEPITEYAFSTARALLNYVPLVMFDRVPDPLLTPDGAGGLRIEWLQDNRNVRVVIPPNPERQTFIYHRGAGEPNLKAYSHVGVVQTLRRILFAA
jgi:hypothetical protein